MAKLFTRDEAERLLPEIDRLLREAIVQRAEYQQSSQELQAEMQKISMLGGMLVDAQFILALRNRAETSASKLKETLDAIQERGCQIKDLEIGLVDFPTHYQGREVCLCWKLGEERIAFWHGTEEGFAGRKPIDDEFLSGHQGEKPN